MGKLHHSFLPLSSYRSTARDPKRLKMKTFLFSIFGLPWDQICNINDKNKMGRAGALSWISYSSSVVVFNKIRIITSGMQNQPAPHFLPTALKKICLEGNEIADRKNATHEIPFIYLYVLQQYSFCHLLLWLWIQLMLLKYFPSLLVPGKARNSILGQSDQLWQASPSCPKVKELLKNDCTWLWKPR